MCVGSVDFLHQFWLSKKPTCVLIIFFTRNSVFTTAGEQLWRHLVNDVWKQLKTNVLLKDTCFVQYSVAARHLRYRKGTSDREIWDLTQLFFIVPQGLILAPHQVVTDIGCYWFVSFIADFGYFQKGIKKCFVCPGFTHGNCLRRSMVKAGTQDTPVCTRSLSLFYCAESRRMWKNLFLLKWSKSSEWRWVLSRNSTTSKNGTVPFHFCLLQLLLVSLFLSGQWSMCMCICYTYIIEIDSKIYDIS